VKKSSPLKDLIQSETKAASRPDRSSKRRTTVSRVAWPLRTAQGRPPWRRPTYVIGREETFKNDDPRLVRDCRQRIGVDLTSKPGFPTEERRQGPDYSIYICCEGHPSPLTTTPARAHQGRIGYLDRSEPELGHRSHSIKLAASV